MKKLKHLSVFVLSTETQNSTKSNKWEFFESLIRNSPTELTIEYLINGKDSWKFWGNVISEHFQEFFGARKNLEFWKIN